MPISPRVRLLAFLGLALTALVAAALVFGFGRPTRPRSASAGRTTEATPIATAQPTRSYAWDPLATGGEDQAGSEPWVRDPDALHPVPTRQCPPVGDCVIDFPYHDEVLLREHQAHSGRVWIPEEARDEGGRFPLLVLLHGIDYDEEPDPPHKLLGAPVDLSQVVRRHIRERGHAPILVAAPSQTRDAEGSSTLWTTDGFDLESFVAAVDQELAADSRVRVDPGRVSVFGHSGSGCVLTQHKKNGLHRVAEQLGELARAGIRVPLLGFMDTCFFGEGGADFLKEKLAGSSTRVFAMWVEPERWTGVDRELGEFAHALGLQQAVPCPAHRYEDCRENDRGWRLYKAREDGLKFVYGSTAGEHHGGLEPHTALTRWFVDEALRIYFAEGGTAPAEVPRPRPDHPR